MLDLLSRADLEALTGRQHADAQARALDAAGIPYRVVDGRPRVLRSVVERELGATGRLVTKPKATPLLHLVR